MVKLTARGSLGPLLCVWLGCTSLTHTGVGECNAVFLSGLALAWYSAEPLCCILAHTYTNLHVKHSSAAQVLTLHSTWTQLLSWPPSMMN